MSKISRRDLFLSGTALATAAAAGASPEADDVNKLPKNAPAEKVQALLLECKFIDKVIDGNKCRLRSFNGRIPGETIKTRPGQTLRIRVKNSLPKVDSAGWNGN